MAREIKNKMIKDIDDNLGKLLDEFNNKISENPKLEKTDFIKEKFQSFFRDGRQNSELEQDKVDILSYYLFAQFAKTEINSLKFNIEQKEFYEKTNDIDEVINNIAKVADDKMGYWPILLENLTKAFVTNASEYPVRDLVEITTTEIVTPEKQKEKEAKIEEYNKQKEARSKAFDEAKKEEALQRKLKENEQYRKDVEEANKMYNAPDPKPEPKVEYVPTLKELATPETIGAYIDVYTKIYSNNDIDPIFPNSNPNEKNPGNDIHFREFTDEVITKKISEFSKENTLSNMIEKVAIYKAQQEKFNKFGWFKRNFSFFYKDASQIKKNMDNLAKSIDNVSPKMFKETIVNGGNPGLAINFLIPSEIGMKFKETLSIDDEKTKILFDNKKVSNKRMVFFETHGSDIETRKEKNEQLTKSAQERDKQIKEYLSPTREQVDLKELDDDFEIINIPTNENEIDPLNKSFYQEPKSNAYEEDNVLPVNQEL